MAGTIWFATRKGTWPTIDEADHDWLYFRSSELDAICRNLGVRPISSFFDDVDVRYNEGLIPESDRGWPASAANWHSADEGLQTFEALSAHLRTAAPSPWDELLEELEDCRLKLIDANRVGRPFHLLIVG